MSGDTELMYLYILYNPHYDDWFKLGRTRDFETRFTSYRSNMPPTVADKWETVALWMVKEDQCKQLERSACRRLRRDPKFFHSGSVSCEWFAGDVQKAKVIISKHLEESGCDFTEV